MNRQATVMVLLVAIAGLLLFGKGKLPRAFGALWGPPSPSTAGESTDAQNIAKGVMGFGAATLVVLAVSDTALYPVAFGVLFVAFMYLLISGGGLAAVAYLDKALTAHPAPVAPPAPPMPDGTAGHRGE